MRLIFVLAIFSSLHLFYLCCDIFVLSKCQPPPAPGTDNFDWELYCNSAKEHVDCINKKLKTCKRVQEFGPALETIKVNVKVIIEQVCLLSTA